MIKELSPEDVADLAKIHVSALPNDLLPSLGTAFLERSFYPYALKSQNILALGGYSRDNKLRAFVIFAKISQKFTAEIIKKHKFQLMWICIRKLMTQPGFSKNLLHMFKPTKQIIAPSFEIVNCPELYVIATSSEAQGKGYGSELVKAGLSRLQQLNYKNCIVKTSSPRAKKFYLSLGFIEIGKEYRGKRVFDILYVLLI